jgi:iron(III) transport system permease protein
VRRWRTHILTAVCLGFLLGALVLPVVLSIKEGFYSDGHFTLKWFKYSFLVNLVPRESLLNSFKVAGLTTLCVFLIALPLAVLNHQYEFRGKRLLSALLMLPMILPPFVGGLAIQHLLAREGGSVNLLLAHLGFAKVDWLGSGLSGVVLLETLYLYPILFLNAAAALANVDPTMVEASRGLGASRWRSFWKVTLPLIRPGLFAGGTIVFIWSFTELGTPKILNYTNVLSVQIYEGLVSDNTSPEIYSLVFVMLSASVGLYAMGKFLFGGTANQAGGRGIAMRTKKAGLLATLLIWLAFGFVTLAAVMPHTGVILQAFSDRWSGTILPESYTLRYMRDVFQREDTWNSIVNSIRYAGIATALDIVIGLVIAYLAVRERAPLSGLLDSLAMLPLAVPGLVIASGYILLTAKPPDIAGLRDFLEQYSPRHDPTLILIVAYSVRRLPYMVRSISAGLQQTSHTLEEASRNLGAGPLRTIWKVTIPLISANVLAGAILTFSFAVLEVSDSLILAQTKEYYPITKTIFSLVGLTDTLNLAAALGVFGMMLLTGTLILASLLLGKKMGAMFRV